MAKAPKTKKLVVDMAGVETRKHIPEGDHTMKAVEATVEDGNEHPYISWVFEITEGPAKGGKVYDNTSLAPKALWRLRTVLEAMGIEVPEGRLTIELGEWVKEGNEFIGTIEHEKYEGKTKARIVDIFPKDATGEADDEDEDEEDEEEKKPAKKGKAKEKPEPEEEEESTKDFSDMDEDELEEFIDEHDLDVDLDDFKKLPKKQAAVKAAFEAKGGDKDEDEDEDEEEKYSADTIGEMGTKELQALIDKHKLGVTLEGTTKGKRRTVIKALRAKGLLED